MIGLVDMGLTFVKGMQLAPVTRAAVCVAQTATAAAVAVHSVQHAVSSARDAQQAVGVVADNARPAVESRLARFRPSNTDSTIHNIDSAAASGE